MTDISYARQTEFVTPGQLLGRKFIIIGCGGIGSVLAWALAKLGVTEFVLWDGDLVEWVNIPNQLFAPAHVGRNKAEALGEILRANGADFVTVNPEFYVDQPLEGIVIAAVDSIEVRKKVIWPRVRKNELVELFFDARIGGPELHLLTLRPNNPDHAERYRGTLFSRRRSAGLPCGGEAFIGPSMGVAMEVTAQLIKFAQKKPLPNEIRLHTETNQTQTVFW